MTNKVPNIRFKGFTDAWEQRKLGQYTKLITKGTTPKDKTGIGDVNFVKVENITNGKIYPINKIKQNEHDNYLKRSRLEEKDILFSIAGTLGRTAIVNKSILPANTNQALAIIRGYDFDTNFLITSLAGNVVKEYIRRNPTVGAQPNLSLEQVGNLLVNTPNAEEQQKIGSFFKQLDNTITLHQRKCEQTKELKKFMLQKMFPKKGEKNPEIRFPGFTDDWEQRQLGEIGKTQSGIGFPDNEQGGLEGVPFFKVSDMNNAGNEHEMKTANNYVSEEQLKRKKWKPIETVPAVMFAKVGAAIMLNRKRIVRTPFLIDNNTMAYVFDESWDTDFGKTLFETINLPRYAQIGALPSYNGSDIESIEISIPNKDEQIKIGSFFSNLDHIITLHQRKCEQLKELKKFMLQNMFPKKG
ncbi:hypothetical protein Si041_00507 [Streptococcus infantarius subsp. infantarius]|nr:hypothetical protein [Streptococcus infantarius subsp. infantarius]